MRTTVHQFDHLRHPDGWRAAGAVAVDDRGCWAAPAADAAVARTSGIAVPGVVNAHSHAFQRAMAGLTEYREGEADSFWSWRERMYALARVVTPDDNQAIAAQLYVEMLKSGYTRVCEFHYLHATNLDDAAPDDGGRAMAQSLVAAADEAGIGLTLLPVLYQAADFGGVAPTAQQRRFCLSVEALLALRQSLPAQTGPRLRVGAALHSLRAVTPPAIAALLAGLEGAGPVHIHIAEQRREVEGCVAVLGARPVAWLLDHAPVDARWTLVHATHMDAHETDALARSGAVVALCPTTEANLGDGLFPLLPYLAVGGAIAIGSDSHVSVAPPEELRWLDYQQRLLAERRVMLATPATPHAGARLLDAVWAGGAQAAGLPPPLTAGAPADLLVLDADAPMLGGLAGDQHLDAWVFSGQPTPVRHVLAGGRWVVRDGHHADEARIAARYRQTMRRLMSL